MITNIITEKELREHLRLSRSSIHRYKKEMGLPFIKLGSKTFYDVDMVKAFLLERSSNFKIVKNK